METGDAVRQIVHFGIPDYYAALEELRHPELKKKPLILAEPGARSIVQGVNFTARREGLREGMSVSQARRFCRRLQTLPLDLPFYREQHGRIVQDFGRFSPLVEGTASGHYFVDLTGTRRLWGPVSDAACRMEERLAAQKGLHASVGLASNKLISQVAARCIPPGDLGCIFPGGEASFLASLPLLFLPGVGPKTVEKLNDFNISRIGQLASFSGEVLIPVLGGAAHRLLKMARGIDASPVFPSRELPRLRIVRHLERDEIDRDRLEAVLFQQVEEAGWELRSRNRYAQWFTLEISYADGGTAVIRHGLDPITGQVDQRLFRTILPVFRKVFQRRVAVRRMVLELSGFSMPFRQLSLFPWEESSFQEDQNLQRALDGIRHRFGGTSIHWGKVLLNPPEKMIA